MWCSPPSPRVPPRYLKAHDEHTEGQHLRIMCPVNVRTEDERGTLGNRVSAIFPVFDAEPTDATARLHKVRWETEQIKNNREAQAMQLMMDAAPAMPPVAMAPTLLVGTPWDPTTLAANFPLPVPPTFGAAPANARLQLYLHQRARCADHAISRRAIPFWTTWAF